MSNFELSPEAQEAMRGDFVLAGEDGQPAATAEDFGVTSAATVHPGLPSDLVEAAKEYLNPGTPLSLSQQMEFNSLIMEAMGLRVPHNNLSIPQNNRLEEHGYNTAPGEHRLVVAPLFPSDNNLLQNRQSMIRNIRDNFATPFNPSRKPLWTPNSAWAYGQLLQNPQGISDNDGSADVKTGLRYRSPLLPQNAKSANPRKNAIDRQTYLDQLYEIGAATSASGGILWTYNFTDIRPVTPRSPDNNINALFESLSATNTPEQELAIQALHLIAGTPNTDWHINITNESVYQLDRKNRPQALRRAATVRWGSGGGSGEVDLNGRHAHFQGGNLGSRASVSGL